MKYKNNPFNIRYDGRSCWQGLSGHKNGFCEFKDIYFGVRTCVFLLEITYKRRGILKLNDIINTFAPLSDGNNPDSYLRFVCRRSGTSKSNIFTRLNLSTKIKVLQAMSLMETGTYIEPRIIEYVYYCWFI